MAAPFGWRFWVVASDLDLNVGPLAIGVGIDAGVLMIVWGFPDVE